LRYLYGFAYFIVIIAGLRFPILGIFVFSFMGLIILAGKRKKWCSSYCPRGSFLDLFMSKVSPRKPIPRWLMGRNFKLIVLSVFVLLFLTQLYFAGLLGSWPENGAMRLGMVFVRMCILSSALAIPLALWKNQRTWCAFCPVGNLLRK